MSKYKRIYLPNHSYFFTVVTAYRKPIFAEDENVKLLKAAFRYVRSRRFFKIDAICILPDHLHCIWTLDQDCDYSIRWQMIKTHFSRRVRNLDPVHTRSKIWQPRFWEHAIRDKSDMSRHIDYIHYNPVKHGLVESVSDWRYSSFGKFYNQGHYEKGWGENEPGSLLGLQLE